MTKTDFACCGFPLGVNSIYALILGISSILLALSSNWGCYFVAVDFVFLNNSPDKFDDQGGMTMGLLSYEDTTSNSGLRCISYSVKQTEAFDEYFRAARTCALGGIVLIGISAMLLCIISCVVVKPLVITCISAALILGGILEGCTFLIFLSEFSCKDCQFYFGAALSLLCTAVTIINGILVWHMQEDAENNFDENAENTESSDKKKRKRPSTPRIVSSSNTSSSDDIIIPERLTAYDKEVVLVLPDGRKQIIEPTISNACCGTGFNIFPSCTS